jgi:hypothetical protein
MEAAPFIGRTIASYRIEQKLGEGGMGTVCRAVHTTLDREVALESCVWRGPGQGWGRRNRGRPWRSGPCEGGETISLYHEDYAPEHFQIP